jgi:hypothetical protein
VKAGVVVHACNPSYAGGKGRRIVAPCKSRRPYLKKKLKSKRLGVALRWQRSCSQVQGPEFKVPVTQKQMKKKSLFVESLL